MLQNSHDCEITAQFHTGNNVAVYRGRRRKDGLPVVLKVLGEEDPTPQRVASLRHEHAVLREIGGDGAIRAYGVEQDKGHWALLLEDIGGVSLRSAGVAGKLSLSEFLALALLLTDALAGVHRHRVIHKDINPSNVIQTPDGRVAFIDFGIATQLAHEATTFGSPSVLEGTLAYISPEQTGRMNRPIDYRTDFYALGATLYELLTGRPPFLTTDPVELVHAHVARTPTSPSEIDPAIPEAVSSIILKLMSKNADDRYQSTDGLRADLAIALGSWRATGLVLAFPLGKLDRSERFRLPQKLYGRDAEVNRLVDALKRARKSPVLTLVAGSSGIGKSALIQELYRPLTSALGYFIAGKYDQYQNSVPYSALLQALNALAQQVLTESDKRLASLRSRLIANLGPNARVLIDVCPAFELVLGVHEPAIPLPPAEARDRFQRAVLELVSAVAAPEHPLCLFLDDLQWADVDSLKLIQSLMHAGEGVSLLLIGAYRDNEVGPVHPLQTIMTEMAKEGVELQRMTLGPLGPAEVVSLLSDTLSRSPADIGPLTELLVARTAGNPFFLRAFLTSLHADGLITSGPRGFQWDMDHIRQRGITDNVVDLIVDRVERLPTETREALELAACAGNHFDLGTLGVMAGATDGSIGRALWEAVAAELVVVKDRVHSAVEMSRTGAAIHCRFAHDRIQQAVIATIAPERRANLHRDAGKRLLRHAGPEGLSRSLFDIVGQLNQGRAAITDPEELVDLASLNLSAAKGAMSSAAVQKALECARFGLDLLDAKAWEEHYELTRDLHALVVEGAFLSGDLDTCEEFLQKGLRNVRTALDEITFRTTEGNVRYAQQRFTELNHIYLPLLGRLGFPLPADPTPEYVEAAHKRVLALCGKGPIEDLAQAAPCTDPAAKAAMGLLQRAMFTNFVSKSNLTKPIIYQLVELSLKYGYTVDSCIGYIFYGILLASAGQIETAYSFGRMALKLAERIGDKGNRSNIGIYAHYNLIHWKVPHRDLSPAFLEAYRYGAEASSPYAAAASATTLCINRLLAGDELGALAEDTRRYADVPAKLRQQLVLNWHQIYQQTIDNLRDGGSDPVRLAGPVYDEEQRVAVQQKASDGASMWNYHFCKMLLAYLFGDNGLAATHARRGAVYAPLAAEAIWASAWPFMRALSLLGTFESAATDEREEIISIVDSSLSTLQRYREFCPPTNDHKIALVEAERARVLGQLPQARAAFERAVDLAERSGYLHEQALASELAGRFHLAQSEQRLARRHLRNAHMAYLRWGAAAKGKDLERRYPYLLPRVATSTIGASTLSASRSGEWDFNILDLISVLDASQTLSREVDLRRLLDRLMELLLEASGAEVGYLLIERDGQWAVEVGRSFNDVAPILQSIPMTSLAEHGQWGVAASIVLYVGRTQQSVVLDDAATNAQFGKDPHIVATRGRSILCFPLAGQTGRRGVVYLENRLTEGAFTPGRIKILQLLSTQAVISMENAELYATLEKKVNERTRLLQEKNRELATTLGQLRETQDRLLMQDRLAALGALTAGIAHELRNPLNFVNNFAELSIELVAEVAEELAAGGAKDEGNLQETLEELRGHLTKVEHHGQRMESIIRSMLDHSRGDRGEVEQIDFNALVRTYVNIGYQAARARGAVANMAIDFVLDASIGPVFVVPQEISRVIVNLVDNACYAVTEKAQAEATPSYAPTILVRTRRLPGDAIELRIRDNGPGVRGDAKSRIFDPFFTTKPPGKGTGLGLSLSHDIVVRGYGGKLALDTWEGEFAEFIVTLPARRR